MVTQAATRNYPPAVGRRNTAVRARLGRRRYRAPSVVSSTAPARQAAAHTRQTAAGRHPGRHRIVGADTRCTPGTPCRSRCTGSRPGLRGGTACRSRDMSGRRRVGRSRPCPMPTGHRHPVPVAVRSPGRPPSESRMRPRTPAISRVPTCTQTLTSDRLGIPASTTRVALGSPAAKPALGCPQA